MPARTWLRQDTYLRNELAAALRVVDDGEYVLPRGDITLATPATTGNLWVTHFVAAKTETITSMKTGVGDSSTVAVDADHAWVGVLNFNGTQYTKNAVSVDDPTLWATEFGTYDTALFAAGADGLAATGSPGFQKVAGVEYAAFVLWIGTGQAPSLPAGGGFYQESLITPRTNAWIGSQTAPPSGALLQEWFAPDSRRFQALLKR